MNRYLVLAAGLLLSTAATAAGLLTTYPYNPNYVDNTLGTIAPYRGTYYDPAQPGTGIMLDIGTNGQVFIEYYTYTADGTPTWYILEGAPYVPSDEVTRYTTGVIGTMNGAFYSTSGGQCLGCAYKPNGPEVPTAYNASLTWVNSREVRMVVGPQTWNFIAPNMDSMSDGDYLPGSWAVTYVTEYTNTGNKYATSAVLQLSKTKYPVVIANGAENTTPLPATAQTFLAECGTHYHSQNGAVLIQPAGFNNYCGIGLFAIGGSMAVGKVVHYDTISPIFWYDPVSNQLGLDIAIRTVVDGKTQYVIGKNNLHYELYLHAPYLIKGRGIYEGSNAQDPYLPSGGLLAFITMTKLPGTVVGF